MWGKLIAGTAKMLVKGLGWGIKPIAKKAAGVAGTVGVGTVADQVFLDGAVRHGVTKAYHGLKTVVGAGGGLTKTISNAFNAVSKDMDRNGIFALIPAAMALGVMTGNGIFGKLISTVLLGALAYVGAELADKNGIKLPGLTSLFKSSATDTAPAHNAAIPDTKSAAPPPASAPKPALQPH